VTRGVSRRIGSSRFELAEGSAEDLLLAALKAKTEHPEATIMYVRPIAGGTHAILLLRAPKARADALRATSSLRAAQ